MKRAIVVLGIGLLVMVFALAAYAQEKATKEEVVAKVKEAVKLAQDKGIEEALKIVGDPKSQFTWKDSYVFAIDIDKQANVAHPKKPALVGKNLMGLKDVDGKMFFAEFINTAQEKGEGWVTYKWPKPGQTDPSPKDTYILLVPGTKIFMAAGVYTN
jgi:signal transduction histidine kinase